MPDHVDDEMSRGNERAVAPIAAAAHLRVRRQRNKQQERENVGAVFTELLWFVG